MLSFVMDSIVLTRGKHLRDNISRSGEVWVQKTSLIPPHFIEVPVPSQESKRSCICMLEVSILPLFLRFLNCFDNGIFCVFFSSQLYFIYRLTLHIFFLFLFLRFVIGIWNCSSSVVLFLNIFIASYMIFFLQCR